MLDLFEPFLFLNQVGRSGCAALIFGRRGSAALPTKISKRGVGRQINDSL